MHYVCDLGSGQQLTLENERNLTHVGFQSSSAGQQQSQRVGIDTGEWAGKPAVYRLHDDVVLKLQSAGGTSFYSLRGNRITPLSSPPDIGSAGELPLRESQESMGMRPMEPMKPMQPMRPMEPMKPMHMQMGNMSMRMGEESAPKPAKGFCTQCGNPLGSDDRFCGKCGQKV